MSLKVAMAWIVLTFITFIHIAKYNAQLQRGEPEEDLQFVNFREFLNHMLNISQVLSTVNVSDSIDCALHCLANVACLSFNFAISPNSSSTLHVCHLLSTDKYNRSIAFVRSDQFHHFTIASPCDSSPCQDGGPCRPLYDKNDFVCEVSGWFKINTEVVCFGAKNDSYGKFSIHKAGKISAFKLAHRSGSVSCQKDDKGTKWGCNAYNGTICTHITNTSRVTLVKFSTMNQHGCYNLPGFHGDSSEVDLRLSSPVCVLAGQEFRIWYAEDLYNNQDDDNHGKSCVDVYGFY